MSCVWTLYKIWVKSNNSRQSYWRFSKCSSSNFGTVSPDGSQGFVARTSLVLEKAYGYHWRSSCLFQSQDNLLGFETQVAQREVLSKPQFEFRTKCCTVGNFGFDRKWILRTSQVPTFVVPCRIIKFHSNRATYGWGIDDLAHAVYF